MPKDREFFGDWVSRETETTGDLGAYFSIEDATEKAWDHQQTKLDEKDRLLKEAVELLEVLEEFLKEKGGTRSAGAIRRFLKKTEIEQGGENE